MVVQSQFKSPDNAETIIKAIEVCGSQAELARKLKESSGVDCYPQKINEWRVRGVIPPYWVRHIASVAGIDKKEIDPALYG